MADRAAKDSTALGPGDTPELHNARVIVAILRRHYGEDVRLPTPEMLILPAWFAAHAARMSLGWTPQRLGYARMAYFKELRRRIRVRKEFFKKFPTRELAIEWIRTHDSPEWRNANVDLLNAIDVTETRKRRQTWPPPKRAIEWIPKDASPKWLADRREWREAIETAPRLFTRPPRFAKQGPLPKRWALVLGEFSPWLASILVQAGAPVSTRLPFAKTCCDILRGLLPNEKMPAISTVSDALGKIIVVERNTANR